MSAYSKLTRACVAGCVGACVGVGIDEHTAWAHDSLTAYGVVWRTSETDGDLVIRSNRGLIFRTEEGPRLLCHDAIGAHVSEKLPVVSTEDGWLVGTSLGVVHLDFRGCPDEAAPRLDTGAVQDLQRDSLRSQGIYVVTAAVNVGSGLYRSEDDGLSFSPLVELEGDQFYNSVAFRSDEELLAYVGGAAFDRGTGVIEHFVDVLRPGGDVERHPVTLDPGELQVRALNVGYDEMLVQTVGEATGELLDRLLKSSDGGASWSTLVSAQAIRHAASLGTGDALLLASGEGLYESDPAGEFALIPLEWKPSCVHARGEEIVVCDALGIHASTDPRHPDTLMFFAEVTEPVSCDGSGAPVPECAADWIDFEEELPGLPSSRPVIPGTEPQDDAGPSDSEQNDGSGKQDHTGQGIDGTASGCSLGPRGTEPQRAGQRGAGSHGPSLWLVATAALSWLIGRRRHPLS